MKRTIAVLLSLILLFSVIPLNASAAQESKTREISIENELSISTRSSSAGVYEGDRFELYIYLSTSGNDSTYTSFTLTDNIDSNLMIIGDVTIQAGRFESPDINDYFRISQIYNEITITVNPEYLSSSEFYYNNFFITIPVEVKEGACRNAESINNSVTATVTDNNGDTASLTSNTETVQLNFYVTVRGVIDENGWVRRTYTGDDDPWEQKKYTMKYVNPPRDKDISDTFYFKIDDNYEIDTVTIEDKEADISDLTEVDGIYSYTFNITAIVPNSIHEIKITTVRKTGEVVAHYVDEDGYTLCDPITHSGYVGDPYATDEKPFYGYALKEINGDEPEGTFEVGTKHVVYVYALRDANVLVDYVNEFGEAIIDTVEITGKVFDKYNTDEKEFYGYELKEIEGDTTGEMTEDTIHIKYVYAFKDAEVIINYLDEYGNKIADSTTQTGKVFDKYETHADEIYGYELVTVPENANGTMTEDTINVDYIYRIKTCAVTVRFVDRDGNELADSVTLTGTVDTAWEASAIDIEGYYLINENGSEAGVFTPEDREVVFVYGLIPEESPNDEQTNEEPKTEEPATDETTTEEQTTEAATEEQTTEAATEEEPTQNTEQNNSVTSPSTGSPALIASINSFAAIAVILVLNQARRSKKKSHANE